MSREKAWRIVILFLLLISFIGYGNKSVISGGILDDKPILDPKNYFRICDELVRKISSLIFGDEIVVIIPFKGELKKDLAFVRETTEKLTKHLPSNYGVRSLSTEPNYRDTGTELLTGTFAGEEVDARDWNEKTWKEQVSADASVYNVLIGPTFNYGKIIIYLPDGFFEKQVASLLAGFFEKRVVPEWEWDVKKKDIEPVDEYVGVTLAGWPIGRPIMDARGHVDVGNLSTIGLLAVAFLFYLSFSSAKQAIMSSTMILLSFVCTRGSIGWLQIMFKLGWLRPLDDLTFYFFDVRFFDVMIKERIYILLVFEALIVAGISFAGHKFNAYNKARKDHADLDRGAVWLLANKVNARIFSLVLVAVLNFLTLYQIGTRGILEVGILSTIGILYQTCFVFFLLPAWHILWGGEEGDVFSGRFAFISRSWDNGLTAVAKSLASYHGRPKLSFALACFFMASVMAPAAYIVGSDYYLGTDYITVCTKPLDYLRGTIVYKAAQILNEQGGSGFGVEKFLVRSKTENGTKDVEFLRQLAEFQKEVVGISDVRMVGSVLDKAVVLARANYKKSFPTNNQEVHDIFWQIESDMNPVLRQQTFNGRDFIVTVFAPFDDSNETREISHGVVELAKKFDLLEIYPYGKMHAYGETDKYIREGKPKNVVSSFWIIMLVTALSIWYWNYRNGKAGCKLSGLYGGLMMAVPFIFSGSVMSIVMAKFRIALDQAVSCVSSFSVNAASDFGFYPICDFRDALSRFNPENAIRSAIRFGGTIVIVDVILNSVCNIPLITSGFEPVKMLGLVTILMLITCGFGALVIMPAFLRYGVRRAKD